MTRGPQVALAVGLGYLLGRTRKMRLALMLAGAGATGRLGTSPRELVQRGYQQLLASPEFGKIADSVRGELVGAAKAAAVSAASHRIESLNSRLTERVDGTEAADTAKNAGKAVGKKLDRREEEPDESGMPEDEVYADDELDQADADYDDTDADDTDDADDIDEPEERPARRRKATASSGRSTGGRSGGATRSSPVRRSRR